MHLCNKERISTISGQVASRRKDKQIKNDQDWTVPAHDEKVDGTIVAQENQDTAVPARDENKDDNVTPCQCKTIRTRPCQLATRNMTILLCQN